MPAKPTRRIFFALWPDEATREALALRQRRLGQLSRRPVPQANLHLTLLFLGPQPAPLLEPLAAAAASIRQAPFTLLLERYGWFPRSGVVWLGGQSETGAALARDLALACSSLQLAFDRRPWRPHVTLFRKVRQRPSLPEAEPLDWPVRDFALVESIPGQPYRILHRWRL